MKSIYTGIIQDSKKSQFAENDDYKKAIKTVQNEYTRLENAFGIVLQSKTDAAPLKDLKLIDLYKLTDPNSLESQISRAQHTRKVFQDSIDDPKQFVKNKNKFREMFEVSSQSIQDQLYEIYVNHGVPTAIALKYSAMIGRESLRISNELLDNEMMPSRIEDEIYARRFALGVNELTNPLRSKVDTDLKTEVK